MLLGIEARRLKNIPCVRVQLGLVQEGTFAYRADSHPSFGMLCNKKVMSIPQQSIVIPM